MSVGHHIFEANAIHPTLGNEVASGRIFFQRGALHFQSEIITLAIPVERLEVELGEGDDERIYFTDPALADVKIIAADQSLLADRALPEVVQIRNQLSARLGRLEVSRRLKIVAGFLASCALLAWVGMLGIHAMVGVIVSRVPPEWEQQYGDGLIADLHRQMQFVEDTNQIAQLAGLAAPLLRALPRAKSEYRFYVVEDDEPNAFALPGNHIIVTSGMLRLARPEELMGAIAHEVAHVTLKHGFRQVISEAGPILICQIFLRGRNGALGLLASGSALLINQSFSQEYEMEADDTGWRYMVTANIDPRGMTELLRRLQTYEATHKEYDMVPQALSSHPTVEKRIARLEAKWKKLPRKTGFIELKPLEQRSQ